MTRLIDADKLIDFIDVGHLRHSGELCYSETEVANLLLHAPTVDAVEVVRCSECIGQSTWYNDAEYGCAVCGMSGMYLKSENGYCSYGIRK